MSRDELRKRWGVTGADSDAENDPSTEKSNDNTPTESLYFGVDLHSPFIPSLKLIFNDGRVIYLPYSLQPILEFIPEKGLYINTMQRQFLIKGRGLLTLADMLGFNKVTWIKESATDFDDEAENLFVSGIEILEEVD